MKSWLLPVGNVYRKRRKICVSQWTRLAHYVTTVDAYTVRISCISLWWCGRRKSLREQIEKTENTAGLHEGDETKTQRRGKKKKRKKSQTGCWKSSQRDLQQTERAQRAWMLKETSRVGAEQHTHFMSRADGQSLTNLLESLFNKKIKNNEIKRKKKMRKHIVYLFYWLILYCPNIMSACSPHTRVNAYYIDWRCISYHHYISIVLYIVRFLSSLTLVYL